MFNRKTIFIIGAGAGFDVDLPTGSKLAEDIAMRTTVNLDHGRLGRSTRDEDLALCFFERNDPKANEYARAFDLIRRGVLLSNSIDDFLNIHEGAPEVVMVGKAAIVRSILNAERYSKLYVDPSNIYNKLDVMKIINSWYVKFMRTLTPSRKLADIESVLDNVSFINFNYDRCLEYFLVHAISLAYGVPKEQTAKIVSNARIIHPYGWVGPLERVPFGGTAYGRMDYRELAKQIKTYTERVEEESTLFQVREEIRKAECIVFLGFAYHKQNMDLLFTSPRADPQKTITVFGTALGMSGADVHAVSKQLLALFPDIPENGEKEVGKAFSELERTFPSDDHIQIENKLDCSMLFDYYAKSLAG